MTEPNWLRTREFDQARMLNQWIINECGILKTKYYCSRKEKRHWHYMALSWRLARIRDRDQHHAYTAIDAGAIPPFYSSELTIPGILTQRKCHQPNEVKPTGIIWLKSTPTGQDTSPKVPFWNDRWLKVDTTLHGTVPPYNGTKTMWLNPTGWGPGNLTKPGC